MGKNFWPIYIIVAALSLAATWKFAPIAGEKMPPATREKIRKTVASCMGRSTPESAPAPVAEGGIKPLVSKALTKSVPAAPVPKAKPAAAGVAAPAVAAQPTAAPKAATTEQAAAPSPEPQNDDELPSLKGIMQADAATAAWGVLNQTTTAVGLDGEEKGAVRGGRIFLIQSRDTSKKTLGLIGNFWPTPMAEPVRLPATSLYCFSGKPESLSQHQRDCLKKYYELRGEAMEQKNKILRAIAERSPYGRDAAAALRAFKEKAKEVEAFGDADGEANRKATYELSQLRVKVQELTQKHKEWKEKHAAELPDPEKDPVYRQKLKEAKAYMAPIAGMAF